MEKARNIILGAVATVSFSATGYVLIPTLSVQVQAIEREDGSIYPVKLTPEQAAGREVYRDLGCMMCHTQQVRPGTFGTDLERGWGRRGSLPVDYVGQSPTLLGTMRTGPDLANIGARQPSETWQMIHLYAPSLTSPGTIMPPFAFLFDEVKGEHADALSLPPGTVADGISVVPTQRAKDLVAYLLSLHQDPEIGGAP